MTRKNISNESVLQMMPQLEDSLTDEQRQILLQKIRVQSYKKNACVYREGDRPHDLCFVISGKLKIHKQGVGGKTQILRVALPQDFLGYRPYFAGEPYGTSATAMEPTKVAHIPLSLLQEMMSVNAQLACFFVVELARHLGTVQERTINLTQKHIRGRLAEAIIFLRDTYGFEEDGCTLCVSFTREEMANLSNMTTANAIRTLSAFVQERLVAVDGRRIKLLDEEKLKQVCRFG